MLLASSQFSQNTSFNWDRATAAEPVMKDFLFPFCHNKAGGVRGDISGVSDPA